MPNFPCPLSGQSDHANLGDSELDCCSEWNRVCGCIDIFVRNQLWRLVTLNVPDFFVQHTCSSILSSGLTSIDDGRAFQIFGELGLVAYPLLAMYATSDTARFGTALAPLSNFHSSATLQFASTYATVHGQAGTSQTPVRERQTTVRGPQASREPTRAQTLRAARRVEDLDVCHENRTVASTAWREDISEQTVFVWPYQSPRLESVKLHLQQNNYNMTFRSINPEDEEFWPVFRTQYMRVTTKVVQNNGSSNDEFRAALQAQSNQLSKNTLSESALKNYTFRVAEFIEFMFRRHPTIFPLFQRDFVFAFFEHYTHRGKWTSSLQHAHHAEVTAHMMVEMKKALNAGALWERYDLMWLNIVPAEPETFDVSKYAFPLGWLPLSEDYKPARDDRLDKLVHYVRQLQVPVSEF